jgi:glycosyltransferase involved in cell wall biosynthesis
MRLKVCLVGPGYTSGGQAVEARHLKAGFEGSASVKLYFQPIDLPLPERVERVRFVRALVRLPLYLIGLMRLVRRADVVHVFTAAHGPFLLSTAPALIVARLLGKPVILNYRDGRAENHIHRRHVRWLLSLATTLVFPSDYLQTVFRRFGYDRGAVIHNVVDTKRFAFRARVPPRPVLLSARLLEPLYAVENTIAAFAVVKRVVPDAILLVAGDGPLRHTLEKLVVDSGLEDVRFLGAVPYADMPEVVNRADIMINSSRIDNMPHCLIEAFAAGMPVVTTPAGGIPYIVRDGVTGLHVPIDDPHAMAKAVLRLLSDSSLCARLVSQAKEECDERYGWSNVQHQWEAMYRSVFALNGSRRS